MTNIMHPLVYEQLKFVLPANSTDYDVKTEQATLFNNVSVAKNVILMFDKEIKVKFNSTLLPLAILPISRSPFQSPPRWLDTVNIFLTESNGVNVNLEVWLW